MVGHHDRIGLDDERAREVLELLASLARAGGCSQAALQSTGGDGPVLLLRGGVTEPGDRPRYLRLSPQPVQTRAVVIRFVPSYRSRLHITAKPSRLSTIRPKMQTWFGCGRPSLV